MRPLGLTPYKGGGGKTDGHFKKDKSRNWWEGVSQPNKARHKREQQRMEELHLREGV